MKILYCHNCDVRIDGAAAVSADGRAFCSDCAQKFTAPARVPSSISTRFKAGVRKAFFSRITPTESQRIFLGSATLPAQQTSGLRRFTESHCKIACCILAAGVLAAAVFCAAIFSAPPPATLIEAAESESQPPLAVTEDAKVPVTILHRSLETAARPKVFAQ